MSVSVVDDVEIVPSDLVPSRVKLEEDPLTLTTNCARLVTS